MKDNHMFEPVLGIPFFRFDISSKEKIEETYNILAKLPYKNNGTNQIWTGVKNNGQSGSDLYTHPLLSYLFDWMQDCISEVCNQLKIPNGMVCNSAWANKNALGECFFDHTHDNCFLSSNYYASGNSNSSTRWHYPNPYFDKTNIYPMTHNSPEEYENLYKLVYEEPTVPGRFIVFPPTIMHRSTPNKENCDRITLAANWFPTGLVNSGGVSHLKLKVMQ